MQCFYPLLAWQTWEGDLHFYTRGTDGKHIKGAKAPNYRRELSLPCGRCIGCKLERSRQWAIRLLHEAQLHEWNSFVTLTFEDEQLESGDLHGMWSPEPPQRAASLKTYLDTHYKRNTNRTKTRTSAIRHARKVEHRAKKDGALSKKPLQKFLKRLRIDNFRRGSASVRYYACGEYGEKLGRPHYHIALFGEAFADDRYKWRTSAQGHTLYRSSRLEKLWPYGHAEIGDLTSESAQYVAGYITKKITGKDADEHYERIDPITGERYWLPPEFSVMSRKPGIGKAWLEKFMTDVYPHDRVIVNGQPSPPPRFYDKILELVSPEEMEEIKQGRAQRAAQFAADNTAARMRDKEQVTKARLALKKRTLE